MKIVCLILWSSLSQMKVWTVQLEENLSTDFKAVYLCINSITAKHTCEMQIKLKLNKS